MLVDIIVIWLFWLDLLVFWVGLMVVVLLVWNNISKVCIVMYVVNIDKWEWVKWKMNV